MAQSRTRRAVTLLSAASILLASVVGTAPAAVAASAPDQAPECTKSFPWSKPNCDRRDAWLAVASTTNRAAGQRSAGERTYQMKQAVWKVLGPSATPGNGGVAKADRQYIQNAVDFIDNVPLDRAKCISKVLRTHVNRVSRDKKLVDDYYRFIDETAWRAWPAPKVTVKVKVPVRVPVWKNGRWTTVMQLQWKKTWTLDFNGYRKLVNASKNKVKQIGSSSVVRDSARAVMSCS